MHPSELLPHGHGFLFVDEILHFEDRTLTARRRVPLNEPWTQSHFPGNPIVPGVLVLEGMVQTCGILARLSDQLPAHVEKDGRRVGMLASIKCARFRRILRPGALVYYRASLQAKVGSLYSFKVSASDDDKEIAEAEVCLSIV